MIASFWDDKSPAALSQSIIRFNQLNFQLTVTLKGDVWMRNWSKRATILLFLSATSSCGDQVPANESLKDFPDQIVVYDDSNEQRAAAVPAARPAPSSPGQYAEFECAAGAPISTANIPSETRDIVENGEAQNVIYYQPAGVTVFGLEARALERFRSVSGTGGVAVYVALDRPSILRAILARYPDARISGDLIESPAMSGSISLQAAQNDLVRIVCLNRASGGGL